MYEDGLHTCHLTSNSMLAGSVSISWQNQWKLLCVVLVVSLCVHYISSAMGNGWKRKTNLGNGSQIVCLKIKCVIHYLNLKNTAPGGVVEPKIQHKTFLSPQISHITPHSMYIHSCNMGSFTTSYIKTRDTKRWSKYPTVICNLCEIIAPLCLIMSGGYAHRPFWHIQLCVHTKGRIIYQRNNRHNICLVLITL